MNVVEMVANGGGQGGGFVFLPIQSKVLTPHQRVTVNTLVGFNDGNIFDLVL